MCPFISCLLTTVSIVTIPLFDLIKTAVIVEAIKAMVKAMVIAIVKAIVTAVVIAVVRERIQGLH